MNALWDETVHRIQEKVSLDNYDKFIKKLGFNKFERGELHLDVPDPFFKEWFLDHYVDLVIEEFSIVTGVQPSVEIHIREVDEPRIRVDGAPKSALPKGSARGLLTKYSFESFVVGPSNQFAAAACKAVAEGPARAYNPLFLYGGTGLGKTHLLHAIGHYAHRNHPNLNIMYISSEHFTNELIQSIRQERMERFRNKYRTECDLLLMDDIQFIAGKERTQEEFFHTFNTLYGNGSQIVVTSDKFPQEIGGLEERIQSRFEQGLIADIQPPEMETRVAILKAKAERDRIDLPDEVAFFLANHIRSNVRELEGALIRLGAFARFERRSIDLPLAKEQLRAVFLERSRKVNVANIQRVVANYFNVKVADLMGSKRNRSISRPRQVAMYLCREHTAMSYPEIGSKFGGKNHTSVLSACRNIKNLIKSDPTIRGCLEVLEKNIAS